MMADRTLRIEFDGDGVTPRSLDAISALEFAHAYLCLLQTVATQQGHVLTFRGLTIEDKCAAVSTQASAITHAERASATACKLLTRPSEAPRELQKPMRAVFAAKKSLPRHYTTAIITRRRRRELKLTEWPEKSSSSPMREVVSLRVMILGVVGMTSPRIRVKSESEDKHFSLKTTRETAKSIAHHLYEEVDVAAVVERDEDYNIVTGELREFHRLDTGDPIEAWDAWYAANNQGWSEVADVESELGRNGLEEASSTSTH